MEVIPRSAVVTAVMDDRPGNDVRAGPPGETISMALPGVEPLPQFGEVVVPECRVDLKASR
jgi:hypothetical protein